MEPVEGRFRVDLRVGSELIYGRPRGRFNIDLRIELMLGSDQSSYKVGCGFRESGFGFV